MNKILIKKDTTSRMIQISGTRILVFICALILCSCFFGCSNNQSNDDEIYLSRAYEGKGGVWNTEDYYYLYFNYIYTEKPLINAILIDTKCSALLKDNSDYELSQSRIYIGGEEQNDGFHVGDIKFLTPNMSITVPISIPKSKFNDLKTVEIEIYYTENSKEITLAKKTFAQTALNMRLQSLLQKDE